MRCELAVAPMTTRFLQEHGHAELLRVSHGMYNDALIAAYKSSVTETILMIHMSGAYQTRKGKAAVEDFTTTLATVEKQWA